MPISKEQYGRFRLRLRNDVLLQVGMVLIAMVKMLSSFLNRQETRGNELLCPQGLHRICRGRSPCRNQPGKTSCHTQRDDSAAQHICIRVPAVSYSCAFTNFHAQQRDGNTNRQPDGCLHHRAAHNHSDDARCASAPSAMRTANLGSPPHNRIRRHAIQSGSSPATAPARTNNSVSRAIIRSSEKRSATLRIERLETSPR